MKEGWEYKKLEEICSKGSSNISLNKIEENYGEYNLYGASGLVKGIDFYHQDKAYIGIVKDGSGVGRVDIYPPKSSLVGTMQYIYPKEDCEIGFLKYLLQGLHLESFKTGAAIPHIYFKDYGKSKVPLPPLSEQQHIVEELDLLSSIIKKKKVQLNELDNLAQSLFYEMFGDPITNEKGWEVRKLADISKEKLSYGSGASAIPYDGILRYIRITDINDSGELNENVVSPNSFEEKYLLNNGDILFARSGATVGKTYCHKEKYGKCIYAGYLIRLIPNTDIVLPSYVFGYTKTQYYMEFVKCAQNAVAQPNINAKQYGNLDICIPPLDMQNQFASKIEAIEHQKELIKQSIKEVETLFNSRLDYYFN